MFESPYGPRGFSCDVCGRIGKKQWLYLCPTCDFDAHVRCVTTAQPHLQNASSVPVSGGGNVNPIRPSRGNTRTNGPPRKFRPNIQSGYPNGPRGQNRNLKTNGQTGPIGPSVQMGQHFGPVATHYAGGYNETTYDEGGGVGDSYGGGDDRSGYDEGGVDAEGEDATYSDFGRSGGDDVYGGDEADDLYPPEDVDDTQQANGPQEPNQNMAMVGPVIAGPGNIRNGPTERPRSMNRYRASGRPNDPRNTNRRTYGYGLQPESLSRRRNNPNRPATIVNGPIGPNDIGPISSNGPDQTGRDTDQSGMGDEGDTYFGDEYSGYNGENYDEGDDDGGSVYSGSYCGSDFSGYVDIGGDGCDDTYESIDEEMYLQADDDYMRSNGEFGDANQFTPMGPTVGPNPNGPRPNGARNVNVNRRNGMVGPNAMTRRTRYGRTAASGPNGVGSVMMNAMVQGLCQGFAQDMMGTSDGGDPAVATVPSSVLGGLLGGDSES